MTYRPDNASLLACTRALARRSAIEPPPARAERLDSRRCIHDSTAMVCRFHDPLLAPPPGLEPPFREIFDALEALRCLKRGARLYSGIDRSAHSHYSAPETRIASPLACGFWAMLGGASTAAAALGLTPDEHRAFLNAIDDQRGFAALLLRHVPLWGSPAGSAAAVRGGLAMFPLNEPPGEARAGAHRADETGAGAALHPFLRGAFDGYKVFDRRRDRVVAAADFVTDDMVSRFRRRLEGLDDRQRVVQSLCRRLQRRIAAESSPHWEFDLDEGFIDGARLAQAVARPLSARPFRREIPARFAAPCVTLLIDLSGSMRGSPILHAVLCAGALAAALERCSIPFEILGYTTSCWEEEALQEWRLAGRPSRPGRLNGLTHVVFKSAAMPWRRAKRHLAWAGDEGLMKENIDGEALLWAAGRLLRRPGSRRLLVVLADGAPHDRATDEANGKGLLEEHLMRAAETVERIPGTTLVGLGLGRDMSRFYTNTAAISGPCDIGPVLVRTLETFLFTSKGRMP